MALLWIDGFDHYGANGASLNAIAGVVGNAYANVDAADFIGTMPILGGLAFRVNHTNNDPIGLDHVLPAVLGSGSTIGMGAHVYVNSYVNADSSRGHSVFHLKSGAGTGILFLNFLSTGALQVRAGSVIGAALATSANVMALDVIYHVEMKVFLHASLGTVEVRVNGVVWINATGLNTLQSLTVGQVGMGAGNFASGQSVDMYWDNLFVWDGTGSVNNDFLSDCVVETLLPNADTADADWTKSSGTDGFNLINDVPANISNYIEAANVGDESIFELTNLSTTAYTIKGVMAVTNAQKTTSGASTIEVGIETNNVQSMSAGQALTQSVLGYKSHMVEQNPDTAAAWTPAEVNAIQVVLDRAA